MKASLPFILIVLSLTAPACFAIGESEGENNQCPALPLDFERSDLVGAWVAEYGAALDTLILREDGKYQQVYERYTDGFNFTIGWNEWWLESGDSGILYLHLENMRRCDHSDELCQKNEGGGGDHTYGDFCADRKVNMPNEVVLIVTGVPARNEPAPRGLWLWQMSPNPDSGTYHFTLRETP